MVYPNNLKNMQLLGRARYNLLQKKAQQDPSIHVLPWQVANYRAMDTEDLFDELSALGIDISPKSFEKMADTFDSPEELFAHFSREEENEQIYPLLFELWRRLLSQYETISIFCDELDFQIDNYEKNPEQNEDLLQTLLFELGDILDDNVDDGQKPKVVFNHIKAYLSADLEKIIYRFIDNLIEKNNHVTASEMINHFSEYVSENLSFDFLKLKLLIGVPEDHATAFMARFIERLNDKPDFHIYCELLRYLIQRGDLELFLTTSRQLLDIIKTNAEFEQVLQILYSFFNLNDLEKNKKFISDFIDKRKTLSPSSKIPQEDKKILKQLLETI